MFQKVLFMVPAVTEERSGLFETDMYQKDIEARREQNRMLRTLHDKHFESFVAPKSKFPDWTYQVLKKSLQPEGLRLSAEQLDLVIRNVFEVVCSNSTE